MTSSTYRTLRIRRSLLITVLFWVKWSLAEDFSYKDENSWVTENPTCGGQRQSPINIDLYKVTDVDSILKFENGDVMPKSAKLSNVGHTIKLTFEWDDKIPSISNGILNDTYTVEEIRFHWDSKSKNGSEHKFWGNSFQLEMHFVLYKAEYGSLSTALDKEDGLVEFAKFFSTELSNVEDEDMVQESPPITQIISHLTSVRRPGSTIDIEPFTFDSIRPIKTNYYPYFVYFGSMTTPPCTENVVWILSTYPYWLSKEQLEDFQDIVKLDHYDDHNNRGIHPLNGRKVFLLSGEGFST